MVRSADAHSELVDHAMKRFEIGGALLLGALCGAVDAESSIDLSKREDVGRQDVPSASPRLDRESTSSQKPEFEPARSVVPSEATHAAIARGLAFLASQQAQEPDGSLPSIGTLPSRLAVTALGALAYMSAGNGLDRGPHGRELSRAIDYLLARVDRDSTSRTRGYISDGGDKNSRMHGHGFATLALAEAFMISPRSDRGARLHEALMLAVECSERSQSLEGGWDYFPERGLAHEGSITIAVVQSLRAAKGAGIKVKAEVIAKAEDYVRRSQAENGGFRYALGSDQITVALTAAAISTLNAAGTYHGPNIQQGYDYIERELRAREVGPATAPRDLLRVDETQQFPFYERLYLAQAFWQNPDRTVFEEWIRAEVRVVLREQTENGSWTDPRFGDTYSTAINVLVLALADELLPILQR